MNLAMDHWAVLGKFYAHRPLVLGTHSTFFELNIIFFCLSCVRALSYKFGCVFGVFVTNHPLFLTCPPKNNSPTSILLSFQLRPVRRPVFISQLGSVS